MELYQIRHFMAVVETQSFTRAAARVGVSQPALSASIAKLEAEFAQKLLHRTPKAVVPTDAGRRLLSTSKEIVSACIRIQDELRPRAEGEPLRIGVLRTLPSTHLASLIAAFRTALPDTPIALFDGSKETLTTQLSQGKLTACITAAGVPRDGIRTAELLTEGYGLVVGPQHRFAAVDSIALGDLQGESFIVRTHCETYPETTQLLLDRGIRTRIVYKTDQDDRALALIAAGLGVALMPASFESSAVRTIRVREFDTKRVIQMEWHSDTADARLQRLIAHVTSHNWQAAPNQPPRSGADGSLNLAR